MTHLDLLLHRPRQRETLLWLSSLLLLIIAFGFATEAYRARARANRLADRLHSIDAMLAHKHATQSVPVLSKAAEQEWQTIRQELDFAWPKLLIALEKTSSKNIELLEFHPDKHAGWVTLKGEARNQAGLQAYLTDLAAQPDFQEVHVIHWQTIEREQLETVEFEIKLRFVPVASRLSGPALARE